MTEEIKPENNGLLHALTGFLKSPSYFFLVVLLLCGRFVYLEQDPPNWIVSHMWVGDEVLYSMGALNYYNHGTIQNLESPLKNLDLVVSGILSVPLTYLGLLLFGKSLIAVRLPGVIISICILFCSWLVLKSGTSQTMSRLLFLYLLVDFYFLVVSRFPTPTLYSALMLSLLALTLADLGDQRVQISYWRFLAIGFMVVFSLHIYIYSIFFALSAFIVAGLLAWRQPSRQGIFAIFSGMAIGVVFYFICIWISGVTLHDIVARYQIQKGYSHFFDASDSAVSFVSAAIQRIPASIMQLSYTNFFRFNPQLLFLSLLLPLPLFTRRYYRNPFQLFLVLSLVLFILQFSFEDSLPERKMFPCLLLIIYLASTVIPGDFIEAFADWRKKSPITFFLYISAMLATAILVICYTNKNPTYMFNFITGLAGRHIPRIIAIAGFAIVCYYFFLCATILHINTKRLILCCVLLLIPNIMLDAYYFGYNRSYYYRDFMSGLGQYTNGKTVIGGDTNQLYNSMISVLFDDNNKYNTELYEHELDRLFSSGAAEYFLVYYFPYKVPSLDSSKGALMRQGESYRVEVVASFTNPLPMGYFLLGQRISSGK
ncbi:MAG: hypothetical protein HQM09_17830 [Candidatus Riflebacteria bacterium]|nr:hypothetical protein [Candidatus Riflebacteria bacterium]